LFYCYNISNDLVPLENEKKRIPNVIFLIQKIMGNLVKRCKRRKKCREKKRIGYGVE
jgi:hypothetical protein